MGFSRAQLESFRGSTVPDLVGTGCRLLFVGINPGLWTAATKTHFCHPSNRFYPALRKAGMIDFAVDTDLGMSEAQRAEFTGAGMGITNLAPPATVRASEVSIEELKGGARRLEGLVSTLQPAVVAVAGITAYRDAFGRKGAKLGRQPEAIGSAELWVVPNPSGLNAHETIGSIAAWFERVGAAAGLL